MSGTDGDHDEEVQALAEHHVQALVLVPPESGVDAVRKAIDGVALAHLSCHGEVRADNPTFSSLLLADGRLTLHEIDRLAGVPHRLVLAACDVGGSVTYPGNEVLGFIGTLLTRGTAGVVGSTTLVLDSMGREVTRATGAPRRDQVLAALGWA